MKRVEYASSEVAHRYARGRALPASLLDGWKAAAEEFLPPSRVGERVLDLGAGTGIFARAWSTWRPCRVIAAEPSRAMRLEMVAGGLPDRVQVVGAGAEDLPLRAGSIDVVWLSAVVHHFADLERSGLELRRVTPSSGVLLVRGLFSDSAVPTGLRLLPGSRRALSRFPSTDHLAEVFDAAGFDLIARREVTDHGPSTVAEASEWIRHLRKADTFLVSLTDDEIETGLAAMGNRDPREPLAPSTLTLLAFAAR
jgi:SAM-dependent methyltransferase